MVYQFLLDSFLSTLSSFQNLSFPMDRIPPLPSSPNVIFHLLKPSMVDLARFVLDPFFVGSSKDDVFSFSTKRLALMVDTVPLHSWSFSKSSEKNIHTRPSVLDAYLTWFNWVEGTFAPLWREVGIYNAIYLSRTSLQADNLLLATTLYFWSSTSNTFLFWLDPFTLFLFDMAATLFYAWRITLMAW